MIYYGVMKIVLLGFLCGLVELIVGMVIIVNVVLLGLMCFEGVDEFVEKFFGG